MKNICGYCETELKLARWIELDPRFLQALFDRTGDGKIKSELTDYYKRYLGGSKTKLYICPKCRSLHLPAPEVRPDARTSQY